MVCFYLALAFAVVFAFVVVLLVFLSCVSMLRRLTSLSHACSVQPLNSMRAPAVSMCMPVVCRAFLVYVCTGTAGWLRRGGRGRWTRAGRTTPAPREPLLCRCRERPLAMRSGLPAPPDRGPQAK